MSLFIRDQMRGRLSTQWKRNVKQCAAHAIGPSYSFEFRRQRGSRVTSAQIRIWKIFTEVERLAKRGA